MPFPAFNLEINPLPREDVKIVGPDKVSEVPDALWPILTKDTIEAAAEFLMLLLDPFTAEVIDRESDYNRVISTKPASVQQALRVSNWASGGGLKMFSGSLYRFKDEALTMFFEIIFDTINEAIPATYSRKNFFHGHSVFDKDDGSTDFRIVFHAYEYPTSEDDTVENTKSLQAGEVERHVAFDKREPNFYKRNVIWSMRNTISSNSINL